jgi:hypothetical protein
MRGLPWLQGEALLEFCLNFLPKFWCSLAWIEKVWTPDFCFDFKCFFLHDIISHFMLQYWAGVNAVTRQQCNYTSPASRSSSRRPRHCLSTFAHPQQHAALSGPRVLMEIGCHGDFTQIPSLRKKYKCHRKCELGRLGLCATNEVRKRGA